MVWLLLSTPCDTLWKKWRESESERQAVKKQHKSHQRKVLRLIYSMANLSLCSSNYFVQVVFFMIYVIMLVGGNLVVQRSYKRKINTFNDLVVNSNSLLPFSDFNFTLYKMFPFISIIYGYGINVGVQKKFKSRLQHRLSIEYKRTHLKYTIVFHLRKNYNKIKVDSFTFFCLI